MARTPERLHDFCRDLLSEVDTLVPQLKSFTSTGDEGPKKEKLLKRLAAVRRQADNFYVASEHISSGQPETTKTPRKSTIMKLKNIKPPSFDGNLKEWRYFWENYSVAVHHNEDLSSQDKFLLLLSLLQEPALNLIKGLSMKDGYAEAVDKLQQEYGDATKLSQIYKDELKALPGYDGKEFSFNKENFLKVQDLINNMRSVNPNFNTKEIENEVLTKFSKEIVVQAYHKLIDEHPTLDFDLALLLQKIERAIYIEEVYKMKTAGQKEVTAEVINTATFVSTRKRRGTTQAHEPKVKKPSKEPSKAREPLPCLFCSETTHRSSECSKYTSLATRKARLTELKRCSRCFLSHEGKCTRSKECRYCHRKGHAIPMCEEYITKGSSAGNGSGTFFQTFICYLDINGKGTTVRGLLDGASDASYIHSAVLQRLKVVARKSCTLNVRSFLHEEYSVVPSARVEVTLRSHSGRQKSFVLLTAPSMIGEAQVTPQCRELLQILPPKLQYADPSMFQPKQGVIEVLLGAEYYHEIVHLSGHMRLSTRFVLLKTFFGWIPSGTATLSLDSKQVNSFLVTSFQDPKPSGKEGKDLGRKEHLSTPEMKIFWDLEVLGIRPTEMNDTEALLMKQFNEKKRIVDGRYSLSWPWKVSDPKPPKLFRMCLRRLESVLKRTPPEALARCAEALSTQEMSGIIERAPRIATSVCHYLPWRPILEREDKIRLVYDGSAHPASGPSLNDLIHTGPSLTKNLVGLLLNFRKGRVAMTADIEKAFHQISLDEKDRDSTRFLWVKDLKNPPSADNLVFYRFTRLPFGVNASPYLLNMVIQDLFSDDSSHESLQEAPSSAPKSGSSLLSGNLDFPVRKDGSWINQIGQESFYVDNLLTSVDSVALAMQVFEKLTEKLASVGFNLRDWTSNVKQVRDLIPAGKLDSRMQVSVLGLMWDVEMDVFSYKFEEGLCATTLRTALSGLQQVFDPLGHVSPCLLDLKLFVQECWKKGLTWDQELPQEMSAKLRKLISEREEIRGIRIRRFMWDSHSPHGEPYELHVFCDASARAYGCVAYLVQRPRFSLNEATLLFAKGRVAPIKENSIPRLELLSVLIGKRTSVFLAKLMKLTLDRVILWTDSTTVLQWLNSTKIQPQFVQNRLVEIRGGSDILRHTLVRYVPTEDNPADIISRGLRASVLKTKDLWWTGPSWLVHSRLWPASPPAAPAFSSGHSSLTLATVRTQTEEDLSPLFSPAFERRYSQWESYQKFAYHSLLWRIRRLPPHKWPFSAVQTRGMAEVILLMKLQQRYFSREINELKQGIRPRCPLDLFLGKDHLLRCRSRLQFASLPWDTVHPILLPRESPITAVIIFSVHQKNHHIGVSQTLAALRERYWIVRGRTLVRKIVANCLGCRKWTGGPYQLPPMPPLPEIRLADVGPFRHTGVDCFGPMYVKHEGQLSPSKVYGVLFTCLVTRAVHLELARDQSANEFLLSFVRFSSRRSLPQFMISDNAKNFTYVQPLTGRKVKLTDHKLREHMDSNRIKWYFIPAFSPWYGGAYERMVGVVKSSLRKALGPYKNRLLDYVTLNTAFCQVENVVNNRPLTYIPSDEHFLPLTPNHFLKVGGCNVNTTLELNVDPAPSTSHTLLQGYKHVLGFVSDFQNAFKSHYYAFLRERLPRVHRHPRGSCPFSPRPGDHVLIQDVTRPRGTWQHGVIQKVDKRGGKAQVRTVVNIPGLIRPANQTHPVETREYTCNRLYPLELAEDVNPAPSGARPSTSMGQRAF